MELELQRDGVFFVSTNALADVANAPQCSLTLRGFGAHAGVGLCRWHFGLCVHRLELVELGHGVVDVDIRVREGRLIGTDLFRPVCALRGNLPC